VSRRNCSGKTLDGKAIVLPEVAAGKVTLLVLGASKKAGDRTGPWKDLCLSEIRQNAQRKANRKNPIRFSDLQQPST
jgi:hypothetical protein